MKKFQFLSNISNICKTAADAESKKVKQVGKPKSGQAEQPNSIVADEENFSPKKLSLCSTAEARLTLGYEIAAKLEVLPLGLIKFGNTVQLTVALAGSDPEKLKELRFAIGKEIRPILVPRETLLSAIFIAYHNNSEILQESLTQLQRYENNTIRDQSSKILPFRIAGAESSNFLATLIEHAISVEASDLHLIPSRDYAKANLRINGSIYTHSDAICSAHTYLQLVSRIKVLAGLNTTERNRPQDGSFVVPLTHRDVYARVSTLPTVYGEKVVLRFIGCDGLKKLTDLGFDEEVLYFISRIEFLQEGGVLFAGPTGSGKSSSMYALLENLKLKNLSLVTAEDPVEVRLEGVAQTEVNEKYGVDYPQALRSILRQDPDVIMVGEIRDAESARISMQAAITGHLILSSVHARNVSEVFLRLRHLGVSNLDIASAIQLIIAQRLLPALCPSCKAFDLAATQRMGYEVFKPCGCRECELTGYSGRTMVAEALYLDESTRGVLLNNRSLNADQLKDVKWYFPMALALERRLKQGRISINSYDQEITAST